MADLSMHFSLSEFQRTSNRALTVADMRNAELLANGPLDDAREAFGRINVTSFLRGSGAHAKGWAVDLQPQDGGEDTIRAMSRYIAGRHLQQNGGILAQVIYEPPAPGQRRGHAHLALHLVPGAVGGYLEERGEGNYASVPAPDGRVMGHAVAAAVVAALLRTA